MIVLAIVFAVIFLLAFLRFGVYAEYGANGFLVKVRVGPFSVRVYPSKAKKKKPKDKKKKKKKEKAGKLKDEPDAEKPSKIETVLEVIKAVKNTLSRIRRKLLIKKLTIRFVAAGEDPAKTALAYGAVSAAFSNLVPVIENMFRIKRRDIRAFADFEASEPSIYVKAVISLAVWEAIYIMAALLPLLSILSNKTTVSSVRKDEQKDGKATD